MVKLQLCTLAVLVVFLASCSASGQSRAGETPRTTGLPQFTAEPQTMPFDIAAPSALAGKLPPRHSSLGAADLVKTGAEFDTALPHQRVAANGTGATFTPAWDGVTHFNFSRLAFAMYAYSIDGFLGTPRVEYYWDTPPADPANVYFGLANWSADRWDWYVGNSAHQISLSGLAPYMNPSGKLLICVMEVHPDTNALAIVRIGDVPPLATLSATPVAGAAPLDVDFDASGSSPQSTIAEYRWDPEGVGDFSASTGTDPHYSYSYQTGGIRHPAVHVMDIDGGSSEKTIAIDVVDSHQDFALGTPGGEVCPACVSLPDGKLMVFSATGNTGVVVSRINPAGIADFSLDWGYDGTAYQLNGAALAPDGTIYTCGAINSNSLIQRWNQDGQLVWSKQISFGSGITSFLLGVSAFANDEIYFAGEGETSQSSGLAVCLRADAAGAVAWARGIETPVLPKTEFNVIRAWQGSQVGSFGVRCAGRLDTNSRMAGLFADFDADGNLLTASELADSSNNIFVTGMLITGFSAPVIYLSGSAAPGGGGGDALSFVNKLNGSGLTISKSGMSLGAVSLLGTPVGPLVVMNEGYTAQTYLAQVDTTLTLQSAEAITSADGQCSPLSVANFNGQGFLVCGSGMLSLPHETSFTLNAGSFAPTWQASTPQVQTLAPTVSGTQTNLSSDPAQIFNRQQADYDSWIHIETY